MILSKEQRLEAQELSGEGSVAVADEMRPSGIEPDERYSRSGATSLATTPLLPSTRRWYRVFLPLPAATRTDVVARNLLQQNTAVVTLYHDTGYLPAICSLLVCHLTQLWLSTTSPSPTETIS